MTTTFKEDDAKSIDLNVQTFANMTKLMLDRTAAQPKSLRGVMILDKCQVMLEYVLSVLESNVFVLNEATNTCLRETLNTWYKALNKASKCLVVNNDASDSDDDNDEPKVDEAGGESDVEDAVVALVRAACKRGGGGAAKKKKYKRAHIPKAPPLPPSLAATMYDDSAIATDPEWFSHGDPVPPDVMQQQYSNNYRGRLRRLECHGHR